MTWTSCTGMAADASIEEPFPMLPKERKSLTEEDALLPFLSPRSVAARAKAKSRRGEQQKTRSSPFCLRAASQRA